MKNTSVEKKAENLKKLVKKPELLLKKVDMLEKQIKTFRARIVLSSHKSNNKKVIK